jgi:Leucine-rich repeat (LRR) protein
VSKLASLQHLDLSNNHFTGGIGSVKQLTSLIDLSLCSGIHSTGRQFSGPIDALAELVSVTSLCLAGNKFTGPISALKHLHQLQESQISFNQFTGTIDALRQLTSLQGVYLNNNRFTGPITAVYNLNSLEVLQAQNNSFTGTLSDGFNEQNMPNLTYVDLSVNNFTAVPSNLVDWSRFTGYCDLSHEAFTCSDNSPMPASAKTNCGASCCSGSSADLASEECDAWQDLFTPAHDIEGYCTSGDPCACGSIPSYQCTTWPSPPPPPYLNRTCVVCMDGHITKLCLNNNNDDPHETNPLGGTIPSALSRLSELIFLSFQDNNITGTLPASLAHLTKLQGLDVSSNQLTGTVPAGLAKLSNLVVLTLCKNRLTGIVPPLPFSQYTTRCDLDYLTDGAYPKCVEPNCNHFSCPLPPSSDKCSDFGRVGVHCE